MPYVYKNLCFFHCPKTGGTSIAKRLRQDGADYQRRYHQHDPPEVCRVNGIYTTVTFVREPVSWYKSWWAFINSDESDGEANVWWYRHNKDLHEAARENKDNFDGFIKALPYDRLYKVYDAYTYMVTRVEDFKNLSTVFKELTGLELGHHNKSQSDFTVSHETFELILKKEAMTLERWFS